MRVDWCVSSWFRIKNTHSLTQPLSPVCLCLLSPVCVCLLLFVPWHRGCAGGGGRGNLALSDVYVHSGCVAANLAVCPVSLFVSVCRSSVSSSSVPRPSIPRC